MAYNGFPTWAEYQAALIKRIEAYAAAARKTATQSGVSRDTAKSSAKGSFLEINPKTNGSET